MKPINKVAMCLVAISGVFIAYFLIAGSKEDVGPSPIADNKVSSKQMRAETSETTTHQSASSTHKPDNLNQDTKVEEAERQDAEDDHLAVLDKDARQVAVSKVNARTTFTSPILNDMKLLSSADRTDFLVKNALIIPEDWKQLPQLAAKQTAEFLKGQYQGGIRRNDGNIWQMHLGIEGSVENERFDGQMKLVLTQDQGHLTFRGEQTRDLGNQIRAVERNGIVSIVILAETQNPHLVKLFQLFFANDDASGVIGNVYIFQNGLMKHDGEVLLQRAKSSFTDPPL